MPDNFTDGHTSRINLRIVLEVPLREFAPWLVLVLLATWGGYPGAVCVTPVAWLIALRVGLITARRSPSPGLKQRLLEAALGGALLGLLQGVLFLVISLQMGPLQEGEAGRAVGITTAMILVGIVIGTVLSYYCALLVEHRRQLQTRDSNEEKQTTP